MADNQNFNTGITMALTNSGAIAGTGSSFTSTASLLAVINGKFAVPLTAQTNAASPVLDANTGLAFLPVAPNQACALVWGINAAGALQLVQGRIIPINVGVTTTVGSLLVDPQFPGLPNDFCPVAYTIVRTAPSAAAWTPGTGAWAASGVSASVFQNVSQLPNRPQAS